MFRMIVSLCSHRAWPIQFRDIAGLRLHSRRLAYFALSIVGLQWSFHWQRLPSLLHHCFQPHVILHLDHNFRSSFAAVNHRALLRSMTESFLHLRYSVAEYYRLGTQIQMEWIPPVRRFVQSKTIPDLRDLILIKMRKVNKLIESLRRCQDLTLFTCDEFSALDWNIIFIACNKRVQYNVSTANVFCKWQKVRFRRQTCLRLLQHWSLQIDQTAH